MVLSADEVAGVVDLFGALPRDVLHRAVEELAFREGADVESERIEATIEEGLQSYALLEVELDGETLLAPGPTAFPEMPTGATDLPHILDESSREVPPGAIERSLRMRLAGAAADITDVARAEELIDVTYAAEAWAGLDLTDVRNRLEAIGEDPGE